MPRIPNALVRKAQAIDPLLPALLAPCRDLHTAQSELRWLREHVERMARARTRRGDTLAKGAMLKQMISDRASGKPLQYIIGTEFFGDLEVRCRPGVLIPRQDTAASVSHLVKLLRSAHQLPPELRLLDLCTGTGCIPLLFQHELLAARDDVQVQALGVDIAHEALELARYNAHKLGKSKPGEEGGRLHLLHADVLLDPFTDLYSGPLPLKVALNRHGYSPFWDILISNPPYISPAGYWKTTTRSVRGFEPKLALVPPPAARQSDTEQGDLFYPRLLEIAREVEAKIVLLEVADLEQARRVVRHARALDIFDGMEIWREDPFAPSDAATGEDGVSHVGEGNARSVLCWRGAGSSWLGKTARQDDAVPLSHSSSGRLPSACKTPDGKSLRPQFDARLWSEEVTKTALMRALNVSRRRRTGDWVPWDVPDKTP